MVRRRSDSHGRINERKSAESGRLISFVLFFGRTPMGRSSARKACLFRNFFRTSGADKQFRRKVSSRERRSPSTLKTRNLTTTNSTTTTTRTSKNSMTTSTTNSTTTMMTTISTTWMTSRAASQRILDAAIRIAFGIR